MAMAKATVRAALALLVVMAMAAGSALAACPQFPLNCAGYVLQERAEPLKMCCIEVQENFQLVGNKKAITSYCEAIKGVALFDGPLTGTQLSLALGLPQKCALNSFKKGQKCNGLIVPGGS